MLGPACIYMAFIKDNSKSKEYCTIIILHGTAVFKKLDGLEKLYCGMTTFPVYYAVPLVCTVCTYTA